MKKYITLLLLAAATIGYAQKVPATKDTIVKDTTKTKTPEKPAEKTPEQKRAEEYDKLIKKKGLERNGVLPCARLKTNGTLKCLILLSIVIFYA